MTSAMRNAGLPCVALLVVATVFAAELPKEGPSGARDEWAKSLDAEEVSAIRDALRNLEVLSRGRLRQVQPRLIELVRHPEEDVSQGAMHRLADIGPEARAALPVLKTRLDDPSPVLRLAAAKAIWRVGGLADQAAAALVAEMQADQDGDRKRQPDWVGEAAARSLRSMGPAAAGALPALLKLMDDPREGTRGEAASVLGALGAGREKQVEPRLLAALGDPADRVRLVAAQALGELGVSLDRAVRTLEELAREKVVVSEENATDVSSETFLASAAVVALGELEADAAPATATLGGLLKSPALAVRLEAATVLGRIGPAAREGVPALEAALRETESYSRPFAHRTWCVGENAAEALGQIGIAAAPALLKALDDEQPIVRARAAAALGAIPDAAPQTVGPLALRLEDSNAFVRIETAKALEKLGPAAVKATPQLVRLLVNEQGVTSFRAGSGLGSNESTSEEAWRALVSLRPDAGQVIPPLVEALHRAEGLSYEAICAIRTYAAAAGPARAPLERLLQREETRVAAACALAFVTPDHDGIQAVLEEGAFRGEKRPDLFPLLGLSRLAAAGRTFDDPFRARLLQHAKDQQDVHLWQCVFCLMPEDAEVTTSFVDAFQDAHADFDAVGLAEAELTAIELLTSRPRLREAVLKELEFVAPLRKDNNEYWRAQYQSNRRVQAAKILLKAGVERERAIACLSQMVEEEEGPESAGISIAELFSETAAPPREAIPLLTKLLDRNDLYVVRGDFYGNGGENRIVGDRAAMALARLQAAEALTGKLASDDAEVRARVVRALGECGGEPVVGPLLGRIEDPDHRVRGATITALGKISQRVPQVRERLKAVVQGAANDPRRNVRDAAAQALAR